MRNSIKNFTKTKFAYVFAIYIILQPVIDVATSLMTRADMSITLGVIIRTLLMVYAVLYVLFISDFKGKKYCVIYTLAITAYILAFLAYMYSVGGMGNLMGNFKETVKTFFFPYVAVFLFALYREYNFVASVKALSISAAIYTGIIFVAYITGTSFVTYNSGYGYSGWFYAANEISDIIAIIAPVAIFTFVGYLKTPDEHKWRTGILVGFVLFCCCFASDYIGTKVVFLFVLLYCIACAVWHFVVYKKERDKSLIKRAWFCVGATAAVILMFSSGSLLSYLSNVFVPLLDPDSEEALAALNKDILAAAQGTWLYGLIENNRFFEVLNWVLSKRLLIIAPSAQEFTDAGFLTQLVGLGYKNTALNVRNIERLIEMDAPALLIRHGWAGFVMVYMPYLASVIYLIVKFFKRFKASMARLDCCTYFFCVLTGFAISTVVGHGLNAPAVSFYLIITGFMLYDALRKRDLELLEGK